MSPSEYRFGATLPALVRDLVAHARWRGAAVLAAMLGGAALEGVGLALLVPLLALLSGEGAAARWVAGVFAGLGVETQLGRLALLLAAFVALILLRAAVLARRDRWMAELQIGFVEGCRARLLAALAHARWGDVAGLRHARVLHALDDNVERTAAAAAIVAQLAAAAAMLAAQWLLVAAIAPTMAGASLLLALAGVAVLVPVLRRAGRLGRSLALGRLHLFDGAAQMLGGLKLAMAQNLQHAFIAEFQSSADVLTRQRLDLMRRFSRSRIAGTTVGALAGAVLVLAGVWYGTPLVSLIAAVAIFTRMIGPATVIQQVAQQITGYLPGYAALVALTAELQASGGADGPPATVPLRASVRFDAVTYRHADGGGGIADVTLELSPGEIIGVVGESGAGKTTFVDLLAGLLEPMAGTIRLGDVPLDPATAYGWRDRIAYVGQDSYLFNDTVRRNLTLGTGDVPDEALWRALAVAGVDDVVRRMPDGLETMVAERGSRVSGGQRQRIALARALLRRPDLLLLDEATNAIDVAGEATIFVRLAALAPRPLIVVVAHRAETLERCERILRFADGRLVGDEQVRESVAQEQHG